MGNIGKGEHGGMPWVEMGRPGMVIGNAGIGGVASSIPAQTSIVGDAGAIGSTASRLRKTRGFNPTSDPTAVMDAVTQSMGDGRT